GGSQRRTRDRGAGEVNGDLPVPAAAGAAS
ncbi:MAG: hypothetical protein QOI51_1192, partial [Nocardioidaceae bacterium]|nr:hypothetical protein [Nocardioidaceae bacterium]